MSKYVSASVLSFALLQCHLHAAEKTELPEKTYKPDGYHIQTLPMPAKTKMNIAGLDVNDKGDVFVSTRLGDVWQYSQNQWSQYASGLHEATGLMIDDDNSIIVAQKPELTRLIDTNNDGKANRYVRLAKGWKFHNNYHEFHYGPVKDKQGNYYATLNLAHGGKSKISMMGSNGSWRGWIYQVNTAGEFVPFASGARSPAGIGISPDNEIFYTDNQGDWVPTSKIHLVEKGKFYGHPASLMDDPRFTLEQLRKMKPEEFSKMAEKPVVWLPHREVANSPGNPDWDITKGSFGPFSGQMFVPDYTFSSIFRVLPEKVNGQYQGAAINFMDGFQSGNIRIKFDKAGQLWVGQTARGWPTKGPKPFGLQKVIWDGTNPFELLDIKLTKTGFKITFTDKISEQSLAKANFTAQQWHYRYSKEYGSPKMDEKDVTITSTKLLPDGKSVLFNMPLTEGKVLAIDFSGIKDLNNRQPSVTKVYYTLHQKL